MIVLGIDPGSLVSGYGVLRGERGRLDAELVDAGRITQPRSIAPLERSRLMAGELMGAIHEHAPDRIVIEIPSGKVGRRHNGGGAGLSIYGLAVGTIVERVHAAYGVVGFDLVEVVDEMTWTNGKRKRKRAAAVAARWSGYSPERDRGLDVADAIGLAWWWIRSMECQTSVTSGRG